MVDTELISCSPISSISSPTPSVIVCWCCSRWLGFIISRAWREKEEIKLTPTHRSLGINVMIFIIRTCASFCLQMEVETLSSVPPNLGMGQLKGTRLNICRMLTMLRMFSLCIFISEASSLERWISSEKCLGFTETLLSCCWSMELNMTSKERGSIPGSLGVPVTV